MKPIIIGLFFMLLVACNQQAVQETGLPSEDTILINMNPGFLNYAYYGSSTCMYIPKDSLNTGSMRDTIQVSVNGNILVVKLKGTAYNFDESTYRKVDIRDTMLISSCKKEIPYFKGYEEGPNISTHYTCDALLNRKDVVAYVGTDTLNNISWVAYLDYQIAVRRLQYEQLMFPIGE